MYLLTIFLSRELFGKKAANLREGKIIGWEDYCTEKNVLEAKQELLDDECHEELSISLVLASINEIFFKCFHKTAMIKLR